MPEVQNTRRQFKCDPCGGRAWHSGAAASTCFRCNGAGELVSEGQEIPLRQFKCDCDGHAWYERVERSLCRSCNEYGEVVPVGEEMEYRQFMCENCNRRRWIAMAEVSKCRECKNDGVLIPVNEEVGVFVCKFICDCSKQGCGCANHSEKYEYRVTCEMTDTAQCYRCRDSGRHEHHVKPYGFLPRRSIKRMTDKEHSCSKCNGSGDCPNLRRARDRKHMWECKNCQRTWFEVADSSLCYECKQCGTPVN